MSLLRRVYRLYRTEGAGAVASGAKRKVLSYLNPIYQRAKPAYKSYSVGPASAEFDMSPRQLGKYDFVDDLRTEQALIRRIVSVTEPDDVFYDIGANIGIYSCLVGDCLRSGKVVAFEPTPDAFEVLKRNVDRNDTDAELFNVALSNENGTTRMSVKGQTGHQFTESGGTLGIETRRADDLVEELDLPTPDICKIDIEGAEYLALDGLRQTLAQSDCRRVFCEIHTDKIEDIGGSAEEVEELLRGLDFELEYLGDRRENYFVEAIRRMDR